VALPLWHARWWLLASSLLFAVLAFAASLFVPLRFTGYASFVVQPVQRASQSVVASALPALAGLIGPGGANPVELHLALLQSQTVANRIIERFDLQKAWQLDFYFQAQQRLSRRVKFQTGRRDGVVTIVVEDELPQRAAAIANQYVEELRLLLRTFALDEATQRRAFYEAQLERARTALDGAQRALKSSGYDRAALRAEPRAAAEGYGRMQAEVTAAEVRLEATRRVRAETSDEVKQQLAELAALRAQLSRLERPRDGGEGAFVERLRQFRYAEALTDSIARQAEAARVDEASDPIPLQPLDKARVPELPSSPRPPLWGLGGAAFGFALVTAWVMLRHRAAMARLDPAHLQRVAQIRAALPRGRRRKG
jgi:uncharacterized protein involved in exopolysaccharide biosynthesis